MPSQQREFRFTEKGIPTLAVEWRGEIPEIRDFAPTSTGRRARGQLTNILDHLCKKWSLAGAEEGYPEMCTAEWLAQAASSVDGKPTSSGAVGRALHKWESLDYAIIADRPLRFVGLTEKGMRLGLEELERKAKKKRRHFDWDAAAERKRKR